MEMGSLRVTNTSCKWSKWLKTKQEKPQEKGTVAMVRVFLIQIITDGRGGRTDIQVRALIVSGDQAKAGQGYHHSQGSQVLYGVSKSHSPFNNKAMLL